MRGAIGAPHVGGRNRPLSPLLRPSEPTWGVEKNASSTMRYGAPLPLAPHENGFAFVDVLQAQLGCLLF